MKAQLKLLAIFNLLASLCLVAHAQGTAFTYQGQLNAGGTPANGSYDVAFTLYSTNITGSAIAGPVTNSSVAVTNGLFTTLVNLGNSFTGTSWLGIAVSTNGATSFTTLTPRQQLTPVPYALFASAADAAGLSGTIPAAQLPGSVVTNGAGGLTLNGVFGGNGAGLTNVPGAWSVNGNNLYYTAGNIGIGTNNPPGTLYVVGSAPSSLVGPVTGVQTTGVPSSAAVVGVCLLPGGNGMVGESDVLQPGWSGPHQANIGMKGVSTTTNGTGVFGYVPAPSGVTYGVIGEAASPQGYAGYFIGNGHFSGNVGIGTATPGDPLHLAGPSGERVRIESTTASYVGVLSKNSQAEWFAGIDPGAGYGSWELFQNSSPAGFRLVVATNGNVGIGNNNPQAPLQVNGNIKLGSGGANYAASGPENLRIVRGVVNSAGTVVTGSGFTAVKNVPTGSYTITFTPAFSDVPAVTASGVNTQVNVGGSISSSSITVQTSNLQGTAAQNGTFSFIAVGPQ